MRETGGYQETRVAGEGDGVTADKEQTRRTRRTEHLDGAPAEPLARRVGDDEIGRAGSPPLDPSLHLSLIHI